MKVSASRIIGNSFNPITHLARRRDVHEGHGRRVAIVAAAAGQEFDALDTAKSGRKGKT